MQFHAIRLDAQGNIDLSNVSQSKLVSSTTRSSSTKRIEAPESHSTEFSPQPGRLNSVKDHLSKQTSQYGNSTLYDINNQQSSHDLRTGHHRKLNLAPEPLNYIRRRRTDESRLALLRSRAAMVVNEVLHPSSPTEREIATNEEYSAQKMRHDQEREVVHMDKVLKEMQERIFAEPKSMTISHTNTHQTFFVSPHAHQEEDTAAVLASHLQELYREQSKVEKESMLANQRIQTLLTTVRNDISLIYKFTPLFKIYSRHKMKDAWFRWAIRFVIWHREEMARLELLAPYAVKIQRVFRQKRSKWARAHDRLALAWAQWQASIRIQTTIRRILACRERQRLGEIRYAIKIQAGWRGRFERKWVKKLLQEKLRSMLRILSPTGNLHRLHEVIHSNPELSRPLNAMLSLIEETVVHVDVDDVYKARNSKIAARNAARPVEATRKQLFHAIFELSIIILQREQQVAQAKQSHIAELAKRQREKLEKEESIKRRKLLELQEKIAEENSCTRMWKEEMETREYLRMLRTADIDQMQHLKVSHKRREESENAKMVIEEYMMRYYNSESRRRAIDEEKTRREVEKRLNFLQEQENQQRCEMLRISQEDEKKRKEIQAKKDREKAEAQEFWVKLSREEQKEASRRLALKEQLALEEKHSKEASDYARVARERELIQIKEKSRQQRQQELDRQLQAREAMDKEDKLSRRLHFYEKKIANAQIWQERREKEMTKYLLDPMHYSEIRVEKETEECARRERYLMKEEDARMIAIHEKERKLRYFDECRERKRQKDADARRALNEQIQMELEDRLERDRISRIRKAEAHKRTVNQMAKLAEGSTAKKAQVLMEAKCRKEMHDEELRQRRLENALANYYITREKHERELMDAEDKSLHEYYASMAKKAAKWELQKRILRMMKEDVLSMERHDWEAEGQRLAELLWEPSDLVAFSHALREKDSYFITNARVFRDLTGIVGVPPFDLDYEAVDHYRTTESTMPIERVPKKKRKPRKFFYHEFYEDDPLLSKLKPPPTPPSTAKLRWKKVAEHFLGKVWSLESMRYGYLLMREQKYKEASSALLEALRMAEASPLHKVPVSLLRQLARCHLRVWERSPEYIWIEKSLLFYQQASSNIMLLSNPQFLQEIALSLERARKYPEAAQVLSGIISCFPRYPKLNEVIFRGGIVMFSLQMYHQSREYLLYSLENLPQGWEPFEILFLVARLLQLEGTLSRKLCSVAYDEAFRANKRDTPYRNYDTWKDWIKAAETWRKAGDAYFSKHEFALAHDAYQLMIKRQQKKPLHLMTKRQITMEARRVSALEKKKKREEENSYGDEEDGVHQKHEHSVNDDKDWLRIARSAAAMDDRSITAHALRQWFAITSYRDRVLEKFYAWPLVRWKLLGVEIPTKVIEARENAKRNAEDAIQKKKIQVETKRREVLNQRNLKAKKQLAAWEIDEKSISQLNRIPAQYKEEKVETELAITQSGILKATTSSPERVGSWLRVTDETTRDIYYWNEKTNDVRWDVPML